MDEDLILQSVLKVLKEMENCKDKVIGEKKVKVGVSARHLHLSQGDLELLFGKGFKLTVKKELMAGEYASESTVTLIGKNMRILEKVRVLGPVRDKTQVELSKTDCVSLGLRGTIKLSGDLDEAEEIQIIGPEGGIKRAAAIVSKRHIHITPELKRDLGIGDRVDVKVEGERGGVLANVAVRAKAGYEFTLHLDTDEANGLGIKCGEYLEII